MATDPVQAAEDARRLRAAVWNFHRPVPKIPAAICRKHFGYNDQDGWDAPRDPIEDGGYSDPTAPAPSPPASDPEPEPTAAAPPPARDGFFTALVFVMVGAVIIYADAQ